MKINQLLKRIGNKPVLHNHEIFRITDDSKECIFNSLFFAITENQLINLNRIEEAISLGAQTVIVPKSITRTFSVNTIRVENPKKFFAQMLKAFYESILKSLKFIGVIGTNGKTTTSTLIYEYLISNDIEAMLVGSNGCKARNYRKSHNNTTPRAQELFDYFVYAHEQKIKYVIMEISSIAISKLRTFSIDFKILIFTNFSEDHLDFHKTMDRYLFAKLIPFYQLDSKSYCIANKDDSVYDIVTKHTKARVISYGINNEADYQAKDVLANANGLKFVYAKSLFQSHLLGIFNVYNILPLLAISDLLHIPLEEINRFLISFEFVEGRMNYVGFRDKNVIIDYAHTEYSIKSSILEVMKITKGKLYVVVGCGGNREKEKRNKIGKLLASIPCIAVITTDNPRYEQPQEIINDIIKGQEQKLMVIENRADAINYCLRLLEPLDYLLILGKGKEDYIEIEGHKYHYSDYEVVDEFKTKQRKADLN